MTSASPMANRCAPARHCAVAHTPAAAMRPTSEKRPTAVKAPQVATAAHTVAIGTTSGSHRPGPSSIVRAMSPRKNPIETSSASTSCRLPSVTRRCFTSASTRVAPSVSPHPQARLAARRQPQRAISHSSASSTAAPSRMESASSPRPCQLTASASTNAAGRPPPRSTANVASCSPSTTFDMAIASAAALMTTSRSGSKSLRIMNCANWIRTRGSEIWERHPAARRCLHRVFASLPLSCRERTTPAWRVAASPSIG